MVDGEKGSEGRRLITRARGSAGPRARGRAGGEGGTWGRGHSPVPGGAAAPWGGLWANQGHGLWGALSPREEEAEWGSDLGPSPAPRHGGSGGCGPGLVWSGRVWSVGPGLFTLSGAELVIGC